MFEFDEEKALKKHMDESGDNEEMAGMSIRGLKKIDERLHPCVIAWLNDEVPAFEFHGLTLKRLIENNECGCYVHAILVMNGIFKYDDPIETAKRYKERKNIFK